MRILVVDDDPKRHATYVRVLSPTLPGESRVLTHVYTFADAREVLEEVNFDRIYLDFDLNDHGATSQATEIYGNRNLNGLDVAYEIIATQGPDTEIVIHSHNGDGCLMMFDELAKAGFERLGFELYHPDVTHDPEWEDPVQVRQSIEEARNNPDPFDFSVQKA